MSVLNINENDQFWNTNVNYWILMKSLLNTNGNSIIQSDNNIYFTIQTKHIQYKLLLILQNKWNGIEINCKQWIMHV